MGCASSTAAEARHAHPDFFDRYVLGGKIGRGSSAQVRVVTRNDSIESQSIGNGIGGMLGERAVKILDLDLRNHDSANEKLQAKNEVFVWNNVGCHEHCVRLYESFFDTRACYMVMERCESNLLGHLESMPELNERTLGGVLVHMLKSLEHVHSVKLVHRDVKPANFLIGGDNGSVVKLSDFGLASMLPNTGKLHGVLGTPPFMAPEMLKKLPYAHEIDMWSFGVVAYTLFFGSLPYEPKAYTPSAMKDAILNGSRPKFRTVHRNGVLRESRRSDNATAFIKAVLIRDPIRRPTASEALQLPFMVAVMEGSHMPGVELPSLRATVKQAKRIGCFEIRDLCEETALDSYLNEMNFAKHNGVLPEFDPSILREDKPKVLNPSGVVHSNFQKNSGALGRFPSNIGRCQSNPWEETSESTSCGTSWIDSSPTSKISSTTSSRRNRSLVSD